jgi:hypothetical protein
MANGIDFVIGGRDQASPVMSSVSKGLSKLEKSTDSLKRHTTGLSGAQEQEQKFLEKLDSQMAKSAAQVKKSTEAVTKFGKATTKTAGKTNELAIATGVLAAAYVAMKGVKAVLRSVTALNSAYDTQTEAVKGLEVALRLQGSAVDVESKRLQAFASDMQKLTGVGDEVTLGLMRQAAMLGVDADQLDDAAKAAIGLSEATGKGLEESLMLVQKGLEGDLNAFGEVIPAIRTMKTEEEKLAAVLALSQRGLEAKAEASNTVAGMSERASGAVGDLMESVGALLAPVRMLISSGIKTLAESLQTLLVPAVAYAEEVLANIGPLMGYVKEKVIAAVNGIVAAFTWLEVEFTNLDKIWEIWVAIAELSMIKTVEIIKWAFTEVIPQYAAWFGENFVNLIRDGLNLAYTITVNRIAKIVDALAALWDFIASGGSSDVIGQLGEIAGRSYLEGFESSLTSLPDVAGRAISEREKELAGTVTRIATDLGDQFSKKFAERMIGVSDGLSDDFDSSIDLKSAGLLGAGGGGGKSGDANLSAKESRLLSRGPGMRPEDLLDQIRTVLEDIRSNTKGTTRMVPQI